MTLARLVFVVAASAALCAQGVPASAWAAPKAAIEGDLNPKLRTAVAIAIGETDRPIENRFEARRRARVAAEDAVALLRSEGYYANQVEADVTEAEPAQAVVRVQPGLRFRIEDPKLEWVGPEPTLGVQLAGEAVMGLANGQAGRAADVLGAEGRILAAVQKRGYADVAPGERQVVVDHADRSVRPTFRIVSGDLVRLDGLDLVSPGRSNPDWLRSLAPWKAGDPYDPDDVGELERRLLDTGVYDSVTVALAGKAQATPQGLRPVVVSLVDRKPRTLELGASYSTSEGFGGDARWTRYNLLGRADTYSYYARASSVDSRLGADLTLPHWRRAQQTLKGQVGLYRTRTDAYDETGIGARADVERRYRRTSFITLGTALDYSQTDERQAGRVTSLGRKLVTASVLSAMALDRSDDPLDPKRGWRVEARLEPTVIAGEDLMPYLRIQGQASAYLPFDEKGRTVLAGRLKAGSIVGGTIPEVPASRRFYSGGGGSVRGYAYQAIGPRLADNTPQGGLALAEASVELRQKIGKHWGVVAFVDAGSVGSDQVPTSKDLSVGAGLGVRYDLGFGPIRADIAVPLVKRSGDSAFQIYLSIGQSF